VIAVDTNILIYAHRTGAPQHHDARRAIEQAANDEGGWGITLTSVAEFWSVVTHPAAAGRPSTPGEASEFLHSLLQAGGAQLWQPGPGFGDRLLVLAADRRVQGPRIFDLQIALTAVEHGARELWTYDRNFLSLPGLRVRDPPQRRK
jgi:toxin-antitoxin system PIN domain toxin